MAFYAAFALLGFVSARLSNVYYSDLDHKETKRHRRCMVVLITGSAVVFLVSLISQVRFEDYI